jgi:NADPH-dependent glutamate synthase beta subunit-like oxidoreductase
MNGEAAPRPTWTHASTEGFHTGTWRSALPVHEPGAAPCHLACPVGGDIAAWIAHAREGRIHQAWQMLTENNPFPAVSGRICHHPCEAACNRAGYDEAIAICALERFIGDRALEENWAFDAVPLVFEEHIAVVGGGPSGLAAAYHLRRRGYPVTLFERHPELGGLLRYGIPAYRLDKTVLDQEIARLLALGIEVRTDRAIDSHADVERLLEIHAAVYIATGAARPKHLPQLDYTQAWVMEGAEYLLRTNLGELVALGPTVAVVGGGSAAMDVARTARRLGHTVQVLSLEPIRLMPAQHAEVVEATEEGVHLIDATMLRAARSSEDTGIELDCIKVNFTPGDRPGDFSVDPIAGSAFTLEVDAVITAVGQDPASEAFESLLAVHDGLAAVDDAQCTSHARVFAGGDFASMARFVTAAFGMGKRAAAGIDHSLSGAGEPAGVARKVGLQDINTYYSPPAARVIEARIESGQRCANFDEVQLPLAAGAATSEAARCFSCGHCIFCDNCFYYCPDMAVVREADGYAVLTAYCKGCGLCVKECPTSSIVLREEPR